jgi:8-oxo-dGTP pyrophosphatase MutT (NUDIX family)
MSRLTHAGGVVRRNGPDGLTFLLVRARRFPFDWVLPKGHIEREETPEQTARREVSEEAGVDAEIESPVGDLAFSVRGRRINVRYFMMRFLNEVPAAEEREVRWSPLEECVQLLEFEDARELVRRAASSS